MKDIIELIIHNIVDKKEEVNIIEEETPNKYISIKVQVAKTDMGRVIGKQGRSAKAIRNLARAISNRQGRKINIEFLD